MLKFLSVFPGRCSVSGAPLCSRSSVFRAPEAEPGVEPYFKQKTIIYPTSQIALF